MAITAFTPFANREVMDLIFVDYNTKKPILNWPLANATATSVTGDVVHAYGGQGHPKRVPFYGEKTGTLTLETQMQSYQLYQIITGGKMENEAEFLEREEIIAASDKSLTISNAPKAGTVNVFAIDDDGGTAITVSVADKKITAGTDGTITSGAKYAVYYIKEYTEADGVSVVNINADTFPTAVIIYGTTISRTEDDRVIAQKLIAYKASAQMQAEWSFSNTGDPASLSITFDLMADEDDRVLSLMTMEVDD